MCNNVLNRAIVREFFYRKSLQITLNKASLERDKKIKNNSPIAHYHISFDTNSIKKKILY